MQTSAVLNGDRANNGQHQEVIEVQILPQVNTTNFYIFHDSNEIRKMNQNRPTVLFIFSWDLIDHN